MVPEPAETAGVHDSFYFSVDGGEKRLWDVPNATVGSWSWQHVAPRKGGPDPFHLKLTKGSHRLTISSREKLTRLDRIAITNSPYAEEPPAAQE
jgi:hypothetical protein